MKKSFEFVAHGGKLVFIGHTKLEVSYQNPLFHSREMTVMGSRNALGSDFKKTINPDDLRRTFKRYDVDGSGTISADEMVELINDMRENQKKGDGRDLGPAFQQKVSKKAVLNIMSMIDKDGNMEIDENEFIEFFIGPHYRNDLPKGRP